MQRFSAEAIRVAAVKRRAPEGGKKKKAVVKRPRPSLGAPSQAARSGSEAVPEVPTTEAETPSAPVETSAAAPEPPPASSSGRRFDLSQERVEDGWDLLLKIGNEDTALRDPDIALRLCELLLLPKDSDEIGAETPEEMMDSLFPILVRLAHVCTRSRSLVNRASKNIGAWGLRRKKLIEEKKDAEEREKAAEARAEKATQDLALRESEVQRLKAESHELARTLEFTITQHEQARQRALVNEARARKAEAEKKKSEDEAAAVAESKAKEAVEEYKSSGAFLADAEFAAGDAYNLGFSDCLEKVHQSFPELDLSDISPEEDDLPGRETENEAEGDAEDEVVEVPPPSSTSEATVPGTEVALAGAVPPSDL